MNVILLIFLNSCLSNFFSSKETLKGDVIAVHDGNTIELRTEANESYQIQLLGIDCPETGQPFGLEAKLFLEKSIEGKSVEAFVEKKDRWGIRQAVVITKSGQDPRFDLLARGLAWTSESDAIPEFESIRISAKAHRKGLWKNENPTPPWVFRRQQTMLAPKSSW